MIFIFTSYNTRFVSFRFVDYQLFRFVLFRFVSSNTISRGQPDLMDFINRARRGSANKEQGEKSCIVSHNNFIFIENFILFCKQ